MRKKKKKIANRFILTILQAFNLTKNKTNDPEQRTETLPEITPTDNAKI